MKNNGLKELVICFLILCCTVLHARFTMSDWAYCFLLGIVIIVYLINERKICNKEINNKPIELSVLDNINQDNNISKDNNVVK